MYKRYFKKVCLSLILILSFSLLISEVLADSSGTFTFTGDDGLTVSVESDSKIKGNVYLRASRGESTKIYRGVFRFVLYKKGLLSYSEYGRVNENTYNQTTIVHIWSGCSKAYYKGTLQLYQKDTTGTFGSISTSFSIGTNNN